MILLTLKKGRDESLRRFHPWIFSGAISSFSAQPMVGELVAVENISGEILGYGFYEGGNIAVRMLHFGIELPPVEQLLKEKLHTAYRLRRTLRMTPEQTSGAYYNDTYRLLYGEADGIPGLVIDVYGDCAVMQAHCSGIYSYLPQIAQQLQRLPEAGIRFVYNKSSGTLPPQMNSDNIEDGYLTAAIPPKIEPASEQGIRFMPDWEHGQKTGFFLDQRSNRSLVEHYAKGRRVLNLFCYTGGFSLYALRGGAVEVISVDSSARAMELCERNIDLNKFAHPERHNAIVSDAFTYLNEMPAHRHDLIILDPPAFAKQRKNLPKALNGYRRLNALALQKIAPGGLIFTFSCSQVVTPNDFTLAVLTAATQSGRKVQILHKLLQAPDHPISIYHPEAEYLKGLILLVTD